jgi:acetolactate synthase-1/3 small subunit
MTIEFCGDEQTAEQLKKQLNKLEDVVKITELAFDSGIFRELVLIKISADDKTRSSVIELANIFRAKVDDVTTDSLTLEITDESSKANDFIRLMNKYGIKEIARTGLTALGRGDEELKNHVKYE